MGLLGGLMGGLANHLLSWAHTVYIWTALFGHKVVLFTHEFITLSPAVSQGAVYIA